MVYEKSTVHKEKTRFDTISRPFCCCLSLTLDCFVPQKHDLMPYQGLSAATFPSRLIASCHRQIFVMFGSVDLTRQNCMFLLISFFLGLVRKQCLQNEGYELVFGGTENHLVLVNLKNKIASGKLKLKMKDWRCSGICNSADRMKDVHQQCGEGESAMWNAVF
ncbi:unnamed protein product [Victoria cruziana]